MFNFGSRRDIITRQERLRKAIEAVTSGLVGAELVDYNRDSQYPTPPFVKNGKHWKPLSVLIDTAKLAELDEALKDWQPNKN